MNKLASVPALRVVKSKKKPTIQRKEALTSRSARSREEQRTELGSGNVAEVVAPLHLRTAEMQQKGVWGLWDSLVRAERGE